MHVQAYRADDDLSRVESAGLGASQRVVARIRTGFSRVLQSRGAVSFSAQGEMLNHLAPVLSRTLALAHLMGQRRSRLMARAAGVALTDLSLDRFSEVMKLVRKAGLGRDLTSLQRGYARRVYDQLRDMGANVDAKTRAVIASLIAEGEPPGRAMPILQATLDKLGVGSVGQSRLETLYRTEAAVAYQAGRWQEDQQSDDVWGYRYVQVSRQMPGVIPRVDHMPLHGTTLPRDDPFWQRYWPPNGWNCYCQVETLYRKHKLRQPGKIEGRVPLPDEGFRKNFGDTAPAPVEFSWPLALDSTWDESQHPRVAKGEKGGGQFTEKEMPHSFSGLVMTMHLGGTTGAELWENPETQEKYVVKKGASPEHALNEYRANEIYRQLGVKVPQSTMIDGKLVTRFIEGKPLGDLSPSEYEKVKPLLQKDFAADAFLGNWDVIGLSKDNIVVDKHGVPWRIDNGGSMKFRAKGGLKGTKWNAELGEFSSMRSTGVAGEVFGSMEQGQVDAQKHVLAHKLKGIKNDWEKLDPVLAERRQKLLADIGVKVAPVHKSPLHSPIDISSVGSKHYMGDTLVEKANTISKKAKASFTPLQLKKLALFNEHDHQLVVLKALKEEQKQALIDAFPGKQLKVLSGTSGKMAKKLGIASSKEAWYMPLHEVEKKLAGDVSLYKGTKNYAKKMPTIKEAIAGYVIPTSYEKGNLSELKSSGALESWKNSLTKKESLEISGWCGSSYSYRQYELEHHTKGTPLHEDAKLLNQALDKGPKYHGDLWRGIVLTPADEMYAAYTTPGNVVHFKTSQSCSRNPKKARGFGSFMMKIIGTKTAVPIEHISHHSEWECVLRKDMLYHVKAVHKNAKFEGGIGNDPTVLVELEELGPAQGS